jgi:predicted O-linked N-acetylglucosamine transferase (SPINDLY family)
MTIEPEVESKNMAKQSSAISGAEPAGNTNSDQASHVIRLHLNLPDDHPELDYYMKVIDVISMIDNKDVYGAADAATSILRKNTDSPEGYFLLGLISLELDDQGRAISMIEHAHDLDPECQEYADALATLQSSIGDLTGGLYFAKLATALSPHPYIQPLLPDRLRNYFKALAFSRPSSHFLNATIEYARRRFLLAVNECEKELRVNSSHASCLDLYGRSLSALAKHDEAASASLKALAIEPENLKFILHVGQSLLKLGLYDEGLKKLHETLALDETPIDVAAEILGTSSYLLNSYSDELRSVQKELIRCIAEQPTFDQIEIKNPKDPEIIHIGYISNDLFAGELAHFLVPIIEHHDKNRFRVYIYQQSETHDSVRTTLENIAESVRQTNEIDDETLSVIICNDEIDVLVDLCGYSKGQRFSLINCRPASVQMGILTPPYGIEIPGINYVLSDAATQKIDEKNTPANQTIIPLNHGLYALSPLEQHPDVNPSPAENNGFITFGGTCDLFLLNAEVINTWAKVLNKLPNSKLTLGNVLTIPDGIKSRVIELFEGCGLADRISFFDSNEDLRSNPEYYNAVDVILDTFPVSGTLSTCEALWMGVPVITLVGEQRESAMGASILTTAGKPDWICFTEDQFVAGAIFLGENISELASIRSTLRNEMKSSPLFNPKSLAKSLEEAYCQALKTAS